MEGDESQCELNDSISSEEELRYVTDDDLISSDDIDCNNSVSNQPIKYNQLNPKADFIYKLLKSAKPKAENIWREAYFVPRIDNSYNSLKSKRILDLNSTNIKMGKSKKRKRDELSSESETYSKKKKAKKCSDRSSPKKVKLKERTHSISSSNDEDSGVMSSGQDNKIHYTINHSTPLCINGVIPVKSKPSQLNHNSSIDSLSDVIVHSRNVKKVRETTPVTNCVLENDLMNSYQDTDQASTSNKSCQLEQDMKIGQEINDTPSEDSLTMQFYKIEAHEETISKYSFLLDDELLENNNFLYLQCPQYINTYNLVNQCLNLEENCALADGSNNLEAYIFNHDKKKITTLAVPCGQNNFKTFRIPIVGNIIVEQSVNITEKADLCMAETPQFVEFPENLRQRHPLLGLDYEDQPRTASFKKSHKRKHSKKHSLGEDGDLSQELDVSTDYLKKKKHKKHKKEIKGEPYSEEDSFEIKQKNKKDKRPKENQR